MYLCHVMEYIVHGSSHWHSLCNVISICTYIASVQCRYSGVGVWDLRVPCEYVLLLVAEQISKLRLRDLIGQGRTAVQSAGCGNPILRKETADIPTIAPSLS